MRVFVTTIPKSGTYLIREVLNHLGFVCSSLHIGVTGTYDYSKVSFDVGRKEPRKCFSPMTLTSSLKKIPENGFAVGHMPYTEETVSNLSSFKVLFVGREPKTAILSHMIFSLETNRVNKKDKSWISKTDPQKQFIEFISVRGEGALRRYKKILPWKYHKEVEWFDYDQVKSNPINEIQRLSKVVEKPQTPEEIENIIALTFNKQTVTYSPNKNRECYWSEQAHTMLDQLLAKHNITYP